MRLETLPPECVLQKNTLFTKAVINELLRWVTIFLYTQLIKRDAAVEKGSLGSRGDIWILAGQSQQHSTKRSKMAEITIKGSKTFIYILYTRKKACTFVRDF